MEAALGLMRRMPPKHTETALSALLSLLPHHSSDLLSQVDQPLQVLEASFFSFSVPIREFLGARGFSNRQCASDFNELRWFRCGGGGGCGGGPPACRCFRFPSRLGLSRFLSGGSPLGFWGSPKLVVFFLDAVIVLGMGSPVGATMLELAMAENVGGIDYLGGFG